MATAAQIEANRRNARLSTGPRTEQGRANSSQNAKTHGLFSSDPIIPGESRDEYQKHQDAFFASCLPKDPMQIALVEQMATAEWKRKRINRLEAGMLQRVYEHEFISERKLAASGCCEHLYPEDEREQTIARMSIAAYRLEVTNDMFNRYGRYESQQVRTFHRSMQGFLKLRANEPNKQEPAEDVAQPLQTAELQPESVESVPVVEVPQPVAEADLAEDAKNAKTNPILNNSSSNQQPATSPKPLTPDHRPGHPPSEPAFPDTALPDAA